MYIEYTCDLKDIDHTYIAGLLLDHLDSWSTTYQVPYKIKFLRKRLRIIFPEQAQYSLFALTFEFQPDFDIKEFEWTKKYKLIEPMNLT